MKMFSMIFTVLVFFGFTTSFAFAEPVYTITNNTDSDELIYIYLQDLFKIDVKNMYRVKSNECLKITTSQFHTLSIYSRFNSGLEPQTSDGQDLEGHGAPGSFWPYCVAHGTFRCPPMNYEFNAKNWGFFREYPYVLEVVDQPNYSRTCQNIREWMQQKEQE